VAACHRQHACARPVRGDVVDLAGECRAAHAHALEARRVELIAVEHAAERREVGVDGGGAVDEIHEHRIAGIAARLAEGALRERRFEEEAVKRMPAGELAEGVPVVGVERGARGAEPRAQFVHAAVDVVIEQRLVGAVEEGGGGVGVGNQVRHGRCPRPIDGHGLTLPAKFV
jgi:hypothetical protein